MKVLSIKEPFASLIADNIKHIETRSWKTNYRGEIYIHASLTKEKEDERIIKLNKMIDPHPGFILCKGKLADCIYMDEKFLKDIKGTPEEFYGRYSLGRYAWVITDVEKIEMIPAKGQLGIWNFDIEKERK